VTDVQWPAEWMRGVLEVCVLRVVGRGPTYGYAIAQALEDAGLGTVKGGTLSSLLARFEQGGLVEVEWRPGTGGPGRKYYTLTPDGREEARRRAGDWLAFSAAARALLTTSDEDERDAHLAQGHGHGHDEHAPGAGGHGAHPPDEGGSDDHRQDAHEQVHDGGAGLGARRGDER
jgi:PadR family transcriptional regulator, regulatory protein PadR